jgi:hypothetical protein
MTKLPDEAPDTASRGVVFEPAEAAPDDDPVFIQLADFVKRGKCILFLGAGVHSPAPDGCRWSYPKEDAPPRGAELTEVLAAQASFAQDLPERSADDLKIVALHYETKLGRDSLVRAIKRMVHEGKRPSPVLRALAALDFPLVITTNYDQLFERALVREEKEYTHCIYNPDENTRTRPVGDLDARTPYVLKIHGDFDRPDSIVVTAEDYIQFILRMGDKDPVNPFPLGLRHYLTLWPTLFLGYSLNDYNLRLLFKTLRWGVDRSSIPKSYAVDPYPDRLLRQVLNEQIIFIAQNVWSFVPRLYRAVHGEDIPQ